MFDQAQSVTLSDADFSQINDQFDRLWDDLESQLDRGFIPNEYMADVTDELLDWIVEAK